MKGWLTGAGMRGVSIIEAMAIDMQMLAQFPIEILGFHSDNGSEYVNHRVAKMLDKLKVEFTRSRNKTSRSLAWRSGCVGQRTDATCCDEQIWLRGHPSH